MKRWLKYGLVLGIIPLIFREVLTVAFPGLFICLGTRLCGFSFPGWGGQSGILSDTWGTIAVVLINIIIYFGLGAIIGLIVSKIKKDGK